MEFNTFIYILDMAGIVAFAVSGALSGARKDMDLFGILFLGFITAVGGGTLRDLLLGGAPVFWMKDINYLIAIIVAVFWVYIYAQKAVEAERLLIIFDAVGLGAFTIIGTQKSLLTGLHPVISVIMGIITAVMGGILRDVFSGEVPLIFRKEIYATACMLGGILYVALLYLLNENLAAVLAISAVITIRLLSVKYHLGLPVVKAD